jgi:hypothetical protein
MRVYIRVDVSLAKLRSASSTTTAPCSGRARFRAMPGPLIKRPAEWSGVIKLAGIEPCQLSEWLHRRRRTARDCRNPGIVSGNPAAMRLRETMRAKRKLALPDGLDRKTESHFRLFEHVLRVSLGEGVAGIVTAAQRRDLFLEGADRGGDHIVEE